MEGSIIAAPWCGVSFLGGNSAKKEGLSGALRFIFSLSANRLIAFIDFIACVPRRMHWVMLCGKEESRALGKNLRAPFVRTNFGIR
jgi:hypothetical protein